MSAKQTRLSQTKALNKDRLQSVLGDAAALKKEFENIPLNKVSYNSLPPFSDDRNRYYDILPNAHSRVVLPEIPDVPGSSYINANFVRGFEGAPDTYVAAQVLTISCTHGLCDFVAYPNA